MKLRQADPSADIDAAALQSLRRLRLITIAIAIVIALLLPGLRAFFGTLSLQQGLDIEANQVSDEVSIRASTRPDVWMFERNALEAELARAQLRARFASGQIEDAKGVVLAKVGGAPTRWQLSARAPIFDSGLEVASVTLHASYRALAKAVIVLFLLGAAIGAGLYLIVTRLTYQSIVRSMREMQAARIEAERAGNARAVFLATMSYEIRTPMNGVIGMTSLLRETPLTKQQREYVETIRSSGEALITVINDILEFSKVESGHLVLEPTDFAPDVLAEDVVALLSLGAAQKGLEMTCDYAPDLPARVHADESRIRQVLMNLVGNAIKFTAEGEVVVRVSSPRDGWIRYQVRDSGIGMTAEEAARVFSPFVQADSSTTRKYGGTGLGLAISRLIADAMQGTITVESVPNKGSTFTFDVPAPSVAAPPSEAAATSVAQKKRSSLIGRYVLVVDDNATNRAVMEGLCQQWGMRSRVYASGSEALADLEAASSHGLPQFDVAVLDLHMPGMDGVDLARQLRAIRPKLPLILLSSSAARPDAKALFDAYLEKPVRRSHLADTLASLISGVRLTASSESAKSMDAVEIDAPIANDEATSATISPLKLGSPDKLNVLLVEDNPINALVVSAMIERTGHNYLWVGSGPEALVAIKEQQYDLVFMDMLMPEMDGLETTRRIRLMNLPYRPYIAALTANVMSEDRDACEKAGMDDFLTKPITLAVLTEYLMRRMAIKASVGTSA